MMEEHSCRARSRVFWNVLEEHRDEAGFYLEQFEAALGSATHGLEQVASLPERRLLAHLDALELGGTAVADALLASSLSEADAERPAATAVSAFCFVRMGRYEELLDPLAHPNVAVRRGARRGAQLASDSGLIDWLCRHLDVTSSSALQASAIGLLTSLGKPPANVLGALQSANNELVLSACEAARHGDRQLYGPILEYLMTHDCVAVRDSAMVTCLAWNSPFAWLRCEQLALASKSDVALALFAGLGGRNEHAQLTQVLASVGARSAVLFALGLTGNMDMLPMLYEYLGSESELEAKLALQAISMISGLDLDDDALLVNRQPLPNQELLPEPDDDEEARAALPPLEADDLEADLVPVPELELPIPNVAAVIERCERERHSAPDGRVLGGLAFAPEQVARYLSRAPMRQRPMLALACSIRVRGRAWLDARALSRVQIEQTTTLCAALIRQASDVRRW